MGRNHRADWSLWRRIEAVGWDVTDSGCWVFRGAANVNGYAVTSKDNKAYYVHRVSLERKLRRPIGPKLYCCHTCDNPPCLNPDHLFEGDAAANNMDKVAKGRASGGRSGGGLRYIDDSVIEAFKPMKESGMKVSEIADHFGVSKWSVYNVLSGRRTEPKLGMTKDLTRIKSV